MYAQALSQDKRTAQTKVVQMMLPKSHSAFSKGGVKRAFFHLDLSGPILEWAESKK